MSDYEQHRGPILIRGEIWGKADKTALAFVVAERARVEKEEAEGQEAVRIALRAVQVHSVGHDPGGYDELDEIAVVADETFARLDEDKQRKLKKKLQRELGEAA